MSVEQKSGVHNAHMNQDSPGQSAYGHGIYDSAAEVQKKVFHGICG